MSIEQIVTLGVLAVVTYGLIFVRTRPDLVLLAGMCALLVSKVLTPAEALVGFSNEGLVAIGALFVVAEGLTQTGALGFIVYRWLGQPKTVQGAQVRIMGPVALLSALMNNTPVVAMMLPVVNDWARKCRLSTSQLLMPLSFATILGGLCSLIGTSTTLVVNGALIDATGQRLGMFDPTWIGVPLTVVGIAFIVFFSTRILPDRKPPIDQLDDPREYTVEMLLEPVSPLVGQSIEKAGLRHLPGMYLMEIDRDGQIMAAVASTEVLRGGDRLVFCGIVDSIIDLQKIPGLKPATKQVFKLDAPRTDRCLIEAVVSSTFPHAGLTIRESGFRRRYNAAVIAVARNGERINKKIGDIQLQPGDTLLLEAHPSFLTAQRNSRDFFLVSRVENSTPPRHDKAGIARLVLVGMVGLTTLGIFPMLTSSLLAALLMIVFRCCRGQDARSSIDWSILLTIAAAASLGKAIQKTGIAATMAESLTNVGGDNRIVSLLLVYLVTTLLTNLVTNSAAALLVFPIAMATAERLGVDHMPFVMSIVVAASAAFLTPFGYQTNLMVYGPGGYRPVDFFLLGLPLTIITCGMTVWLVPLIWPY